MCEELTTKSVFLINCQISKLVNPIISCMTRKLSSLEMASKCLVLSLKLTYWNEIMQSYSGCYLPLCMMSWYFGPINFTRHALLTQKKKKKKPFLLRTNIKDDKIFSNYSVLTGRRKKSGCSYRIMDLITSSNLITDLITKSNLILECYKWEWYSRWCSHN